MRFATDHVRRLPLYAAGLAIILTFSVVHRAQAQNLVGDPSFSVPDFGGTGLQGYYYSDPGGSGNRGSFDAAIANSIGPLGNPAPLATFLSTNICYPSCNQGFDDSTGGLVSFLNGNATNIQFLNTDIAPPTTWNDSGLILNGYVAITTPGSYSFSLGSDDASNLRVGTYFGGAADLTFATAGLYALAVNFTEDGGGSILRLIVTDDSTGACILGCTSGVQNNGFNGVLPNNLFYSDAQLQGAPAPAIGSGLFSIAILALLAVGALARHRRLRTAA